MEVNLRDKICELCEIGQKSYYVWKNKNHVKLIALLEKYFTKEDLEEVSKCGYRLESYRKMDLENGQSFDSLFFMDEKIKPEALERAVPRLFSDKSCGEVFRIKGFVKRSHWR